MTKYKCGCESDGVIIANADIFNYIHYEEWSQTDGVFGTRKLCLYCWFEKNKLKAGLHCGYIKGKWKK